MKDSPGTGGLGLRDLLLILAVALAVRLAATHLGDPSIRQFGDDDRAYYQSCAQGLAEGKGLGMPSPYPDVIPGRFRAFRAPALPAIWAAVWAGDDCRPVRAVLAVLGAAVALACAWTGALLGGRRAGIMAGLLAAVHPKLVWLSVHLLAETPCLLAVVLASACALRAERGALRWAFASGALLGLAALARPAFLGFLPVSALWLGLPAARRRAGLALLAGGLVVMLPWWVRNQALLGAFVPATTDGGRFFYMGNHPAALGHPHGFWTPPDWGFLAGLDEVGANRKLFAMGLAQVREHPGAALLHALEKAGRLWRPWPHADVVGTGAAGLDGATFLPLLLAAAWGVREALRRGGLSRRGAVWVLLLAGFTTAVHMAFVAITRYRAPVEAALIPFAGIGLARLGRARRPTSP